MLTALSNKPDYIALSFVGLMIAFAAMPYIGQIDLLFSIVPDMDTVKAVVN